MTTKSLKAQFDAPPKQRTPFYLPLCALAVELAQLADSLGAAEDAVTRPLVFDYNLVEEAAVQVRRVRVALEASKKPAPDPTAPPSAKSA